MTLARVLAALLVALALAAPAAPAQAAKRCRAIDGDTIRCGRERIRLRNVYAAERGEPGAEAARRALQRRLDSGEVRIRRHGRDAYGRTLGDVYVNGRKVRQADIGPRAGHGAGSRKYGRPASR
jgi:micrococcal nuclease